MNGTMIKRCKCKHKFQDERYGVGLRLFNMMGKPVNGHNMARCTVCGTEKRIGEE